MTKFCEKYNKKIKNIYFYLFFCQKKKIKLYIFYKTNNLESLRLPSGYYYIQINQYYQFANYNQCILFLNFILLRII